MLQVSIGDRVLPIAAFRGSTRPVLIVGSKGHISRAMRAAEPFKPQLRQRGISLITLQTDELDSNSQLDALKVEFGRSVRPLSIQPCYAACFSVSMCHFEHDGKGTICLHGRLCKNCDSCSFS